MAAVMPAEKKIQRISIIDDEVLVRETYSLTVEDANYEPVPWNSNLVDDLAIECQRIAEAADAVITDWNLKVKGYSRFNGAELAAALYTRRVPTVLCTKFDHTSSTDIRKFRRFIPVLMNPSSLTVDSVREAMRVAQQELLGSFGQSRKPWRALLRIEAVERNSGGRDCTVYIVIPAWDHSKVIEVDSSILNPLSDKQLIPDFRFYAQVNLGAEHVEDLYITEVEQ